MKALVISDKQEIIDSLNDYLQNNNYDIIVYRWLLKALDNIEEIRPDIVVLSSSEYPRHWKTLASFIQSGIGGNKVKIYLYDPEPLSSEEKTKAEKLGIQDFLNSLSLDELRKIESNNIVKENIQDETNEEVSAKEYELILTHPLTGMFLFGKAVITDKLNLFECEFDKKIKIENDTFIKYVSVKSNNVIKSFTAKVLNSDNNKITIKVCDYYEEEI